MSNNFNPVRGMRDFNQPEMNFRNKILNTIETICKANGFNQIKTPIIENKEFLNKGNENSENNKLGFSVSTGSNTTDATLGLRYDLTVPLARFFGANKAELTLPFRSYQTGEVYRAERPQRGRYREFTQCDIDVVGDKTVVAELDILNTAFNVFDNLKIDDVKIVVNDKQVLLNMLTSFGFDNNELLFVVREIDKLDKISVETMAKNLLTVCDKNKVDKLVTFLTQIELYKTNEEKLVLLSEFVEESYLTEIINYFGERIIYNPFLARGMDYYTGIIFEAKSMTDNLSIAAGGRYDNFKETIPAVGLSFGFERIIPLVEQSVDVSKSCVLIYGKDVSINLLFTS